MSKSERREVRVSSSEVAHDKVDRSQVRQRPPSPAPTFESIGGQSMEKPIHFEDRGHNDEQISPESFTPTCVSASGRSMAQVIDFNAGGHSDEQISPESLAPTCLSASGRSMAQVIDFNAGGHSDEQIVDQRISTPAPRHQTTLDSVFTQLQEAIGIFINNELKKFKKVLGPDHQESSALLREDDEVMGNEDEDKQSSSSKEAFLTITLNFLRKFKQEQLADSLQNKTCVATCQRKLKSNLKRKFQCLFEGTARAGNPTLLNQIYTELYITEGESRQVIDHEVTQIEAAARKPPTSETTIRCQDIFKSDREEPVRCLMTKGVAGVGKTVLTQKYILDWAEDKSNHNIQFIFPFTFRELNMLKEKNFSLVELLHHIFTETKEAGICRFEDFRVLFILDGLDEYRHHLNFHNAEILTDVTEPTSVQVLLTNLIRGKLLPSALLWITTRPAAASQIPPECVDMVTEVRGFTDPQKEEYFRKRFRDEKQANRVISHTEMSRSLHTMCRIPVFCWITATVLEHALCRERGELPKTLTEMCIHFLVFQTRQGNVRYYSCTETDPIWNQETKMTVLALGKLAFERLENGGLIFYEAELRECNIDIRAASVYSGLFTEIFNGEHALNEEKMFCFVHLCIQEFLAALHVSHTFINTGTNLLSGGWFSSTTFMTLQRQPTIRSFYQKAVGKSLDSPNGHLDLFVRFLLGLSLETNQTLLRGLLTKTGSTTQVNKTIVQYIKKKINANLSPEKSINLFHCLNELNDLSLVEEIQQFLRSGSISENKLSHSQWSALVFILLSSQKDLDEFNLKKYTASEEGLERLLPVVKASRTSLLSGCDVSWRSCEALVSVLTSKNSNLRELDLSNNDLRDMGVMRLSNGLKSPNCKLEILSLSGCLITERGCTYLASALESNPSHLRELDLSFNHPGDKGVNLLLAGLRNPQWKLKTLKIDHCGPCRLTPSPLRYKYELSLDPNTADRNLFISDNNKKVILVKKKQPYPPNEERFDNWKQLLGSEGLTGRCYWEVKWKGTVNIGVTYRGIKRRGGGGDCCLGWNDQSWSLICSAQGYTAWHNNTPEEINTPRPFDSNIVGVFLDWPAGTVSFYCLPPNMSSIQKHHLHTFQHRFTEPVYPAFGFVQRHPYTNDQDSTQIYGSSLSLSVEE